MEDNVVISVESLSKGYKTKTVLNDLSFSVRKVIFMVSWGKMVPVKVL